MVLLLHLLFIHAPFFIPSEVYSVAHSRQVVDYLVKIKQDRIRIVLNSDICTTGRVFLAYFAAMGWERSNLAAFESEDHWPYKYFIFHSNLLKCTYFPFRVFFFIYIFFAKINFFLGNLFFEGVKRKKTPNILAIHLWCEK